MIGTEMLEGQGLGNQLFCYVTARAIAADRGVPFGTCHPEILGNNMHARGGMYFMEIDTGVQITDEMKRQMVRYDEKEERIFTGNSRHDLTHGCYIAGADEGVLQAKDNTLLYGNLQDERYFEAHREELKDWLRLKPDYDIRDYTADDLCIIHLRYGDYSSHPELLLDRSYWLHGMDNMRKVRPDMRFLIVTESLEYAHRILPETPAVTGDIGRDYAILKNARYLLLGNSSFAVFPAYTSDTLQYAIAPKYWARHNVSDGYWASEQNIYSIFHYQDRKGALFTATACREELAVYKETSVLYGMRGTRPTGTALLAQQAKSRLIHGTWYGKRVLRSLGRRLRGDR